MPEVGWRSHVAVTGGRQRLDAEIEIVDRSAAGDIRDRLVSDPEQRGENRVEGDKHQHGSADESRPRGRHRAVADVCPETEIDAFRDNFNVAAAEPDHPRLRGPLSLAPGHLFESLQAGKG